jgi:CPA1 family monovalent cation:H+ antiporter
MLARALGVAEPEPRGFLIVGANPVARVIAKALQNKDYDSLLCDTNWSNIRAARMQGLSTFYGSAVSEYADRRLDLVGLGRLLALSSQPELNVLAAHRYRREFGDQHLYVLRTNEADTDSKQATPLSAGHVAFGDDVSYARLTAAISVGAEVHETTLTENFDFDDYYRKYYKKALPLFAIDPKGRLHTFTAQKKLVPGQKWTVLSLVEPEQPEPEQGISQSQPAL